MLSYRPLKNHGGIILVGDYHSLCELHDVIGDVNDKSTIVKNREGLLLGLSYDVRKAFEKQREIIKAPELCPEYGTRFGVKILWPVLLVQTQMLRACMGYMPTTKWQQAVAFNLEAVVEDALRSDFGSQAEKLIARWNRIDPRLSWAEEKLDSRGAIFSVWTKNERKKHMDCLLASLDPMYPMLYQNSVKAGNTKMISPEEFDSWTGVEWPDAKC